LSETKHINDKLTPRENTAEMRGSSQRGMLTTKKIRDFLQKGAEMI
jgi:hypothetical protein